MRVALIWLGAIALLGGFAWAETRYGCSLLSRGGSVLVVYGALIGYLGAQYRARYGEELDRIQADQVLIAQLLHYEDKNPDRTEYSTELIQQKFEQLSKRLSSMRGASKRFLVLRYVELPILLVGTALWGFGDLLRLGAATCVV